MTSTEAAEEKTIVERLTIFSKGEPDWEAGSWAQMGRDAKAEIERLQARVAEEIASLESAIADVERLQSELNTALERVKVLEDSITNIWLETDTDDISFDALAKTIKEARAVLQSSGGK